MKLLSLNLLIIAFISASAVAQEWKEPRVIGDNVGVDGSHCEDAKAEWDLIAAIANERNSNVIIIGHLGSGERSRRINRLRLSQIRSYLFLVRAYGPERVIVAEGERVRGLGLVEVYINGNPFIIYRMRRNKDFFTGNFGC
jgi:hypothetical protein